MIFFTIYLCASHYSPKIFFLLTEHDGFHTSYTKVYFNEFVANALRDNIAAPYLVGVPERPRNLGVHKRGEA